MCLLVSIYSEYKYYNTYRQIHTHTTYILILNKLLKTETFLGCTDNNTTAIQLIPNKKVWQLFPNVDQQLIETSNINKSSTLHPPPKLTNNDNVNVIQDTFNQISPEIKYI